jgi:putative addiction module CopG family antidote
MTIHLSTDREQFVRSLIQAGQYASEDEVIADALQLLEEHNKLTALRQEIAIGIEQADRGELEPFDPHATLARVRSRQPINTGNA